MHAFSLAKEQEWNPKKHVEKILGEVEDGDYTVACWEPGQISPNHCHPHATEIYFCFTGGGKMRTPKETIDVVPGSFVVHPPGEVHEYINGPERTLLFVRGVGAIGYPGSAEVVNMQPPAALIKKGITSLPCIGDGRQSGTSGSP